jgi:hypothetical protein
VALPVPLSFAAVSAAAAAAVTEQCAVAVAQSSSRGEMLNYCSSPEEKETTERREVVRLEDVLTVHEGFSDSRHR